MEECHLGWRLSLGVDGIERFDDDSGNGLWWLLSRAGRVIERDEMGRVGLVELVGRNGDGWVCSKLLGNWRAGREGRP